LAKKVDGHRYWHFADRDGRAYELIFARVAFAEPIVSGRERPGSHPVRYGIG
jgi:hypothetical protein